MPPKSKASLLRQKQEEISALKNKLSEAEAQLKEEKRINTKLRYDAEQKIQQLTAIEESIQEETDRHRWHVENINNKRNSFEEVSEKRLKSLIVQENQITLELASFEVVANMNERLQKELKEVAYEHYKQAKRNLQESEVRKQKNFDTRMQLDQVLRSTIKMFTKDYHSQALMKMDQEAAEANRENVKLYAQFDLREETCENLIRQQKQSYEQLMKLRIEREVVAVTSMMHEQSAEKLRVDCETQQTHLDELSGSIYVLEQNIAELQAQVARKGKIRGELDQLKNELRAVKFYRRNICRSVMKLAKHIMKESLKLALLGRSYHNSCLADSFLNSIEHISKDGNEKTEERKQQQHQEDKLDEGKTNDDVTSTSNTPTSQAHGNTKTDRRSLRNSWQPKMPPINDFYEDGGDSETDSTGESLRCTTSRSKSIGSRNSSFPSLFSVNARANDAYSDVRLTTPAEKDFKGRNPTFGDFDYSAIWNSSRSECNIISIALRKQLRREANNSKR